MSQKKEKPFDEIKMKVLQSTFNFLPGRSKQIGFSCLLDQIFLQLLLFFFDVMLRKPLFYLTGKLLDTVHAFYLCFPVVLFRTLLYVSQTEK